MTSFEYSGSFDKTEAFLRSNSRFNVLSMLKSYGQAGVTALASVTPVETGLTANSWDYEVSGSNGSYEIVWTNSNIRNGFPVAIMLQYGHGTGTGGFVQGRDYINPAIRPIFDKIANEAWKAVISI